MKKKNVVLMFFTLIVMSCSNENGVLAEVFDEKEMETVDELISYYDGFIMRQTINKSISLEKAYMSFFRVNTILLNQTGGDIDLFRPDALAELNFFKTLDQKTLSEIFEVGDINAQEKAMIMDYKSPSFHVNTKGKYMELLNKLAARSDFYKSYAEYVAATGDLGPKCYDAVMTEFQKFNIKKKDERLVLIVNMLRLE